MTTGPQHYRKAEELIDEAARAHDEGDHKDAQALFTAAQIHATLALAAATALNSGKHGMPYADANAWQNTAGVKAGDSR